MRFAFSLRSIYPVSKGVIRIVRMWDEKLRTLIYLGISRKLIDGAPANSISTVPVMPWGAKQAMNAP